MIISEPYILFPIDFVKKKIIIRFTIEKLLFINLYFLFAPHEYKILRQSPSWEIIDKEDLYYNLFQTMIRAVFKEGNKKKTNKNLEQLDALEKGHYKYRFITLLTIFFFVENNAFYLWFSFDTSICYHFNMDNRRRLLLNWVCSI